MPQKVEGGRSYSPDRNRVEDNKIVDSGPKDGIGIDVRGIPDSITISRNGILKTRQPLKRIGVRIGPRNRNVHWVNDQTEGFAVTISDLRPHSTRVNK